MRDVLATSPTAQPSGPKPARLPKRIMPWYLKGYKLRPDVVFDVGVFEGTGWLYKTFPGAKFVLIDPQADSEQKVAGKLENFDFHAVALGEEKGTLPLRIPETKPGKGGAMASMMIRIDRLANRFTSVKEVDVPVERLDDIAKNYDGRVGLKIDAEGFEAKVLAGAPETLKRTDFVVLEMSVDHRFENTVPPSVIIARLAAAGLEFRDVLSASTYAGNRPRPRYMDALFTRWEK